MKYINAKDLFPGWLLEKLQDYAQGELVYIPRKETVRAGWGEANGTKGKYMERNVEIFKLYKNGCCVDKLSEMYNLSECSIRKILSSTKQSTEKYMISKV